METLILTFESVHLFYVKNLRDRESLQSAQYEIYWQFLPGLDLHNDELIFHLNCSKVLNV